MSKKVLVKKSNIHGMGLFAAKKIRKGDVIGELEVTPTQEDGPHVLWVAEGEKYTVSGPLAYINHSVKPNAVYYDDLTVVAIKDIRAGDEITHHYGDEWE